ncbi:hypothetical protein BJ742DRAFT_735948 [Cladochytrium replicatum]|nr:hypothetical protein BJ742DRAFT_735948 [Cladochytrium replicatum]
MSCSLFRKLGRISQAQFRTAGATCKFYQLPLPHALEGVAQHLIGLEPLFGAAAEILARVRDKTADEGDDDDDKVEAVTDEPVVTLRETTSLLEKALKGSKGELDVLEGLL